MTVSRSKAGERYAEIQKRERDIRQELDNATKLRLEKTAKLRPLLHGDATLSSTGGPGGSSG